ncbi:MULTISPECIES: hypothetical protein [Holospora]|uniref:hypothetical protein n=1 Tax=Holospora TaxID=44747 RepID=UPI00032EBCD9|nr:MULTISPECIES: hypothetical protein [Holospora]
MTKSYSNDLRQRGIEYLDEVEASQLFKISLSAIGRWHKIGIENTDKKAVIFLRGVVDQKKRLT